MGASEAVRILEQLSVLYNKQVENTKEQIKVSEQWEKDLTNTELSEQMSSLIEENKKTQVEIKRLENLVLGR